VRVRPRATADREWSAELLVGHFGSTRVVRLGVALDAAELPGLVCEQDGQPVGLLTYAIDGTALEVVTIGAMQRHRGVGTALLHSAVDLAGQSGCERVWLITTNDNLDALRFYQRRGFRIVAVHRGGADRARVVKPSMSLLGAYDIPMRDELELELAVSDRRGQVSDRRGQVSDRRG
jgi:ribosomal protein S18 acetylase RimI-like enzyme